MFNCKRRLTLLFTLLVFALGGVVACGDGESTNGDGDGDGYHDEDAGNGDTDDDAGNGDTDDDAGNGDTDDAGNGDTDDTGNGDTDVDDDTVISTLTDGDELDAACDSIKAYNDTVLTDEEANKADCALNAWFTADSTACEDPTDGFDACVAETYEEPEFSCALAGIDRTDCSATLAEIKACDGEVLGAMGALGDLFICDDIDSTPSEIEDLLDEIFWDGTDCQVLAANCEAYVTVE